MFGLEDKLLLLDLAKQQDNSRVNYLVNEIAIAPMFSYAGRDHYDVFQYIFSVTHCRMWLESLPPDAVVGISALPEQSPMSTYTNAFMGTRQGETTYIIYPLVAMDDTVAESFKISTKERDDCFMLQIYENATMIEQHPFSSPLMATLSRLLLNTEAQKAVNWKMSFLDGTRFDDPLGYTASQVLGVIQSMPREEEDLTRFIQEAN